MFVKRFPELPYGKLIVRQVTVMAKMKITNDMEYWQLKEDYARSLLAVRNEADKKKKKQLEKESNEMNKVLSSYEKKKIKGARDQQKEEEKRLKIREKETADKKIFFEISAIEAKYIDYASLTKIQRNKLSVKKESMIEAMKKGMYIRLKGDSGLYQIKQSEKRMNGMRYVSTVVYGDVPIQDVALIIIAYYYEKEIETAGHLVSD